MTLVLPNTVGQPVKPITIFCDSDRALCPSGSTTKRGVIEAIDQPRRESLEEKAEDRRRSRKMFADRVSVAPATIERGGEEGGKETRRDFLPFARSARKGIRGAIR
ncbi:hypothetical protein K0M31_019868 [Melipona bicolor]|uniref:Uncharacterized protein n=1 Tax=Melipona bicolor TaxID=60889 RepID=A0AA40G0X6_9HYME|nr:hypothetical protein K0M31_019868 [Melipona bicolor]